MSGSHHPNYHKIYYTLLVLLLVSVAGPFLGIKWVTLITAFGIAVWKATLVVQNFMHLKWERRLMKIMLAGTVTLLLLFFFGVAPDVMKHTGRNWRNDAALAATARGIERHGGTEGTEGAAGTEGTEGTGHGGDSGFDARAAFMTNCAPCHGQAGGGDGLAAASLNPRPADFSDPAFWRSRTDEQLLRVIREGGAAVGRSPSMPAWGGMFDTTQTRELLEFIRAFRRS